MQTLDCENTEKMKLRDDLSILLLIVLFLTCVQVEENALRIEVLEEATTKTAILEAADSIIKADSIVKAQFQETE